MTATVPAGVVSARERKPKTMFVAPVGIGNTIPTPFSVAFANRRTSKPLLLVQLDAAAKLLTAQSAVTGLSKWSAQNAYDGNAATEPAGVCQVAAVVPVAVSTCPEVGAVAAETLTTVDAVRRPLAVRSSVRRASLPTQKLVPPVPNAASACVWSARANEVETPSAFAVPGGLAVAVAQAIACVWSERANEVATPSAAASSGAIVPGAAHVIWCLWSLRAKLAAEPAEAVSSGEMVPAAAVVSASAAPGR